jgi:hypothetical protein
MPSDKVHRGTTNDNTAEATELVQRCNDIDLSDLTGVDISSRLYMSLLSNNGMPYSPTLRKTVINDC